jgi:hypothetical protein
MDDQAKTRPLSIDDMVGILIHRTNQLSAYLGTHGVRADLQMVMSHLVSMYSDVEIAQRMMDELSGRTSDDEPQQTTN